MYRVGSSFDIHKLVKGNQIVVGGVKIPCDYSLIAHSDGDVVYHAVSEAILGGLGLSDLGTYFPTDDHKLDNIDSSYIVQTCYEMMIEHGYRINNIDVSIILEKIKLKNYINEIKINLSKLLHIDIEAISVKAMTNEEQDSLGQGKSIASFATVLLSLI